MTPPPHSLSARSSRYSVWALNCGAAPRQAGFTLLEVLVALAIFAVAAAGLLKVGSSYVQGSERLQTRTLAHWVAMNQAAQLQINHEWIEDRTTRQVEEQGRHWSVLIITSATPFENVRRADIAVSEIESGKTSTEPVTDVVAFLSRTAAASAS